MVTLEQGHFRKILNYILMNKHVTILTACTIASCLAFAQPKSTTPTHGHEKKSPKFHYGTASFYSNKFEGKKTANGEIFSQKNMTAASNIVSLNTYVKVTNLHNKRSAIVKVTDRMHPKNKRLIDLSRAAAKQLGYTGRGLTKVKVEILGKHRPPDVSTQSNQE
ncbi:MAG: septal ring lytic transglycosylase RlpA family lipoprotein [Bacteroidetes bacterium]|nr:MAG: septal ring lytic transglycosylase RlpA family lipoprotein [Bacteroidota bacterium]